MVEDLRIYRDVYYTHPIGWIVDGHLKNQSNWGIMNTLFLAIIVRLPKIAELGPVVYPWLITC